MSCLRCTAAVVLGLLLSFPLVSAQVPTMAKQVKSERVQAGLKGPLKICEATTTTTTADEKEYSFTAVTEYDPQGRKKSLRTMQSGAPAWLSTWEYDDQGRLLKTTQGQENALTEVTYSYDNVGRLRVKSTKKPGSANPEMTKYEYDDDGRLVREGIAGTVIGPIQYRYDALGRKTQIIPSDPNAPDRNTYAIGMGAMFAGASSGALSPPGGRTELTFDDQDRVLAAAFYAADGTLTSRVTAAYTTDGYIQDQHFYLENILPQFPPEQLKKVIEESGATREQLDSKMMLELEKLLGKEHEFGGSSFKYDSSGRVIEERNTMAGGVSDQVRKTTYNDRGDIEEIHITDSRSETREAPASKVESVSRYTYVYDSFGNWTEQKSVTQAGDSTSTVTVTRKLTYF